MTTGHRTRPAAGSMRPLDPFRDLGSVVELISLAFGERLDPAGRATVERMRRFADSGPLMQWAWAFLGRATVAPGLVWVVDGQVVGNVSLRRARGTGGYLIGNVVVHPDHRGKGIASALMNRAIRVISRRGARWVGLEVRADNDVARSLYERLGFEEVGRTHHLLREAGSPGTDRPADSDLLRRGRPRDSDALMGLAKQAIPEKQRPLLEIQESDYLPGWRRRLERWLRCEDEIWWVAEEDEEIKGAVRAVRKRGAFPNQMEVLLQPENERRIAVDLVRQGVIGLGRSPNKAIEISLPQPTDSLLAALEEEGFQELRVLVQMKRSLGRKISVQIKR